MSNTSATKSGSSGCGCLVTGFILYLVIFRWQETLIWISKILNEIQVDYGSLGVVIAVVLVIGLLAYLYNN